MASLSSIDVNTRPYERSHMKAPRGRGSWAFAIKMPVLYRPELFWHNGTYAEARRAAVAEAVRLGGVGVEVQP